MVDGGEPSPKGAASGRPVVVGYNGKEHSRDALRWAAAEAARRGCPLMVVHAANYPGMTPPPGTVVLDHEPGALDADQELTVRGVAEALEAFPDLRVAGATEVSAPADALTDASSNAALVVVGTRGYGRVVGTLLGSVAFAVAARATCPVIVVRGDPADHRLGLDRSVVVGTDGSSPATAAVGFAADRAANASANLEIVTCPHDLSAGSSGDGRRTRAESIARSAADSARRARPGLTVSVRIEDGPADRALVAASAGSGLVVVGTRGRGALEGMLLGSVSRAVIAGARCPVAVVGDHQGW